MSYSTFGEDESKGAVRRPVYSVNLYNAAGDSSTVELIEVPRICLPLYRSEIPPTVLEQFRGLQLADDYGRSETYQFDVVIGCDHYWDLVDLTMGVRHGRLVALHTMFGYVLSGMVGLPGKYASVPTLCCFSSAATDDPQEVNDRSRCNPVQCDQSLPNGPVSYVI